MDLLRKIILVCVMHCVVATSPPKFPPADMATEWNQTLSTDMVFLSKTKPEELFYDTLIGDNNASLAVLQWTNAEGGRTAGFNLTTMTHAFSGMSMGFQPCSFPAEEGIDFFHLVKLVYLRSDRVLVYFTKTHKTKGNIQTPQVINPETCTLLESVNTAPYVKFAAVNIVPFKNTFDVVFENQELCPGDSWCRLTFDHDGKKIGEPTSLFAEKQNDRVDIQRVYPMNYESDKQGSVIAATTGVYSPIRGWVPTEGLTERNHFYSNTKGFASICWQTEKDFQRDVKCTWLDGSHKDKKNVDTVVTVPFNQVVTKAPYVHNTPKGKIALLHEGRDNEEKVIFSDTFVKNGKCKRYLKVPFSDELKKIELAIVNDGVSCVSTVTRSPISENTFAYKFATKCSELDGGFRPEKIDCGKDYTNKEGPRPPGVRF